MFKMPNLFEAARSAGIPFSRNASPTQGEFASGELKLKYLDWGNRDAPAVLLLHGFAQTAHSWDFVSLSLSNRYHVVALDARGHGDSDWSPARDYSPEAHQRDLDHFVEHLGISRAAVIGLSMGGKSAYTLAARQPGLVGALVIVDTGPVTEARGGRRIRSFVSLPDERDSYEDFVQSIHEYQPLRSIQQIRDTLINNVRQSANGKWTWKYDKALRDPDYKRPVTSPEDGWAHLRNLKCKTLLVRGAKSDVLSPEMAVEMKRVINGCDFVEVPKAGHIVPGDNPNGFISAVSLWLETSYPVEQPMTGN